MRSRRSRILGASWDLEQVIEEHGVDHVVVAFSTAPSDVLLRQMQRCERLGIGSPWSRGFSST